VSDNDNYVTGIARSARPNMTTLKVYVFVVVVLCSQEISSLSENLIEDGSFEEYKSNNTWKNRMHIGWGDIS